MIEKFKDWFVTLTIIICWILFPVWLALASLLVVFLCIIPVRRKDA